MSSKLALNYKVGIGYRFRVIMGFFSDIRNCNSRADFFMLKTEKPVTTYDELNKMNEIIDLELCDEYHKTIYYYYNYRINITNQGHF